MKAKELAEILLKYPEAELVVSGYEFGVNPVKTIIRTQVKQNPIVSHGFYSCLGGVKFEYEPSEPIEALYLGYGSSIGDGLISVEGEVIVDID